MDFLPLSTAKLLQEDATFNQLIADRELWKRQNMKKNPFDPDEIQLLKLYDLETEIAILKLTRKIMKDEIAEAKKIIAELQLMIEPI